MSTPEDRWRTDELGDRLARVWRAAGGGAEVAVQVQARDAVDSTNTRLLEAARDDARATLRLMVAEAQTAGRGRRGRAWHAAPGASLCFSIAVPLLAAPAPSLSLAMAVAVADALEPPASPAEPMLLLKWPNDLWLRDPRSPGGGRKLGGLLLETAVGPHGRVLVAGLGLNLRPFEGIEAMNDACDYGIATLAELDPDTGHEHAAADRLHTLGPAVLQALLGRTAASWRQGWVRRDILAGRRVEARGTAQTLSGVAMGIDDDGSLRLRSDDDGLIRTVASGEISLRALEGAPR